MLTPESLEAALCNSFCGSIQVRPVGAGYAVSTLFGDGSGDRLSFYVVDTPDGYQLEDDGAYLSNLVARDVPITEGSRGQLLNAILKDSGAFWDQDTYEIKTGSFSQKELASKAIEFLSGLIRVRDLELLTREVVRSTFREDVIAAIMQKFGSSVVIRENAPVANDLAEFPADIVVEPRVADPLARSGAIYLVNNSDKLNEALLAHQETVMQERDDVRVIAMIEEPDMKVLSRRRFQRAQNRSLAMPIFRGDEDASMLRLAQELTPRRSFLGPNRLPAVQVHYTGIKIGDD